MGNKQKPATIVKAGPLSKGRHFQPAKSLGGRTISAGKANHAQMNVEAKMTKSKIESRLSSLNFHHIPVTVKSNIVGSHDAINSFVKSSFTINSKSYHTIKVGSENQIINHITEDVRKVLNSFSFYGKAGAEVTGGIRLAAGVGKGLSVDVNVVSLQLMKYEVMYDGKDDLSVYNKYI